MYGLTVHSDAKQDLYKIHAKDKWMAAKIAVWIQELESNDELRRNMAVANQWFGVGDMMHEAARLRMYSEEVYRLKVKDLGELIPYRLIYVFDDKRRLIHILAIMERSEKNRGYEDDKDLTERVCKAIHGLKL